MSFLFPKTADKSQAKQQAAANKASKKAVSYIKTDPITNKLDTLGASLVNNGLTPTSYAGPGYNIGISSGGNINMARTGETQGFMDRLGAGMDTDEGAFGSLLSQLTPGFGRLSSARAQDIRNAASKAIGNLKDNLGRRRVLGSSFANDQIGSVERQYALDEERVKAEALVEELKMTNEVINSRSAARNQALTTAFSQIQFEGDVGQKLLQSTQAAMNNLQLAQVDLAKTAASITAQGQIAKANVYAGIQSIPLQSAPEFAGIKAQEAAAPANFIGTVAGAALGGGMFGGVGSGGLMPAKTSTFPV